MMNSSFRSLLTALLLISSLSIPYTHTESNAPQVATDTPQQVVETSEVNEILESPDAQTDQPSFDLAELEHFVVGAKQILDEIYNVVSSLSMMINDGQIKTVINKKDVTSRLMEISLLIHNVQQDVKIVADPITAYTLLEINTELIEHLLKAIAHDLRTLPEFDLQATIARAIPRGHQLDSSQAVITQLQKRQEQTILLLDRLKKSTETVGLLWYNRAYRKFDNYVIAPIDKYSLHKWTIGLGAIGAASLLTYWHFVKNERFNDNAIVKKMPNFITQSLLGPKPKWEGPSVTNQDKLGLLGTAEMHLYNANAGHMVITAGVFGFAWKHINTYWNNKAYPWISKKISSWHNTLKGGAYLQRAAQVAEKLEEVTFDDLVGCNEVKQVFGEIVQFILDPEYYARRGQQPPKGILLVGKSRTGKSYSVSALATHIKHALKAAGKDDEFKYISVSAADIQEAGGVEELMRLVKYTAPCILFIDEIDLLDLQRKGYNPMLMAFLTHMDGAIKSKDPKKQVILIGATTNPENLDKALRQDGRFEKEIVFELPSYVERKVFLERKISKLGLPLESFDLDKIARETEGKAFATLGRLLSRATLRACFEHRVVNQDDLELMLDKEVRNIIMYDNKLISNEDKHVIAAHFAGKALILHDLNNSEKLAKVTIRPVVHDVEEKIMGAHLWDQTKGDDDGERIKHGALFTYHESDTANIKTYEQKIHACKVLLAGFIAEEITFGACGFECHKGDVQKALQLIQSLAFEGVNIEKMPAKIQVEYQRNALKLLEQCKQEVRETLNEKRAQLDDLTLSLALFETLDAHHVARIIEVGLPSFLMENGLIEMPEQLEAEAAPVA